MSWYSKIYVAVREYRTRNPIRGYFLHLMLNAMLFIQICGLIYGFYVYMFIFLPIFVMNTIQRVIYMVLFLSLYFMFVFSLLVTIITPIAKIPEEYHVDQIIDSALKQVTPETNGRYFPDQSSVEQIKSQNDILNEFALNHDLEFVELDSSCRLRYCYQCCLIKPDRAHHCSSCGFCVVKFDHHCPWINKCVNANNYKSFFLYLIYGELMIMFGLITQLQAVIVFFAMNDKKHELVKFLLVIFNIILHCIFSYFPLGELLKYHIKLLADNETTCEQAKTPNIRGDPRASYNHGWYLNYRSVFGWGLWALPIPTPITDGMHFHVKYSDDYIGDRYEVVVKNPENVELSKSKSARQTTNTVESGKLDEKDTDEINNNNNQTPLTPYSSNQTLAATPKNE